MAAKTKPDVIGVFGSRGTGKTSWLRRRLASKKRLAIFDYKNDPRMRDWGTPYTDIRQFIKALDAKYFTAHYLVQRNDPRITVAEQFRLFCLACMAKGELDMFVDELPMVTAASHAPRAWRECVNVGREYTTQGSDRVKWLGISITAQRPSEVDKTFIGNMEIVHSGRLGYEEDAKVISKLTGVTVAELMGLPDLAFVEKSVDNAKIIRGRMTF
jgi:hypothetical protein